MHGQIWTHLVDTSDFDLEAAIEVHLLENALATSDIKIPNYDSCQIPTLTTSKDGTIKGQLGKGIEIRSAERVRNRLVHAVIKTATKNRAFWSAVIPKDTKNKRKRWREKSTHVCFAYAPHAGCKPQTVRDFWENLAKDVKKAKGAPVVIAMDSNAIHPSLTANNVMTVPHLEMETFMITHGFCVIEPDDTGLSHTHTGTRGEKRSPDVVITNRPDVVRRVRVSEHNGCSDHQRIEFQVCVETINNSLPKRAKKRDKLANELTHDQLKDLGSNPDFSATHAAVDATIKNEVRNFQTANTAHANDKAKHELRSALDSVLSHFKNDMLKALPPGHKDALPTDALPNTSASRPPNKARKDPQSELDSTTDTKSREETVRDMLAQHSDTRANRAIVTQIAMQQELKTASFLEGQRLLRKHAKAATAIPMYVRTQDDDLITGGEATFKAWVEAWKSPGGCALTRKQQRVSAAKAQKWMTRIEQQSNMTNDMLNKPFEGESFDKEFERMVTRTNSAGTPGPLGIHPSWMTRLGDECQNALKRILKVMWNQGVIPHSFQTFHVKPLYKGKGPRSDPMRYRPIALMCTPMKALEMILEARLRKHLESCTESSTPQSIRGKNWTINPRKQTHAT
jgi:hypothetical protein